MADLLTPEDKALVEAHDKALLARMKARGFNAEHGEAHWEQTLSELTGGRYDMVVGLRLFVAELRVGCDRQAFIDAAATKIISGLVDPENYKSYARQAYDMAEALWEERRRRRQGTAGG